MVAALVLTLAGCDAADHGHRDTAAPSTSPASTGPTSSDVGVAPRCRAGTALAVGRSAVDSTLGRRYLRLDVRNCTARPLTLERPKIAGRDDGGGTANLRVTLAAVANRPDRTFPLPARGSASAGISWRVEPRGSGIDELRVTATAGGPPERIPIDLFDMRLTSLLDYYPWVSQQRDVFS